MEVVYTEPPDEEISKLKLTVAGMRAKLHEYKRFKAKYADTLLRDEMRNELWLRVSRENKRLRKALAEIAMTRSGTTNVKYLSKYAAKVLVGLGYGLAEIESSR